MSSTTQNLQLVKPDGIDELHQTIQDIADNMQKLDDVADIYMTAAPTSGIWIKHRRVYNTTPTVGNYVGWVNLRLGSAAPTWSALATYTIGDKIVPTVDNGHFYMCTQPGHSGVNEPVFPVTSRGVVVDINGSTTWQPSTHYALNIVVVPSVDNGLFYVCTVAGNTATTEPTWPTIEGQATTDNTAVWTSYKKVTWEEQGTATLFRPFGKIE